MYNSHTSLNHELNLPFTNENLKNTLIKHKYNFNYYGKDLFSPRAITKIADFVKLLYFIPVISFFKHKYLYNVNFKFKVASISLIHKLNLIYNFKFQHRKSVHPTPGSDSTLDWDSIENNFRISALCVCVWWRSLI